MDDNYSVLFNFCESKIDDSNLPASCVGFNSDNVYAFVYDMPNKASCTGILKDGTKTNTLATDLKLESTEYVAGVNLTYESGNTKCLADQSQQFLFNVEVYCSDDYNLNLNNTVFENNQCKANLMYTSKQGCSKFQYGILA